MTDTNQEVRETPEAFGIGKDPLGLCKHADALTGRAATFRKLHGNMLMYGEGQAQTDEAIAGALRTASITLYRLSAEGAALASAPPPAVPDAVGVRATRLTWQVASDADYGDPLFAQAWVAAGMKGFYRLERRMDGQFTVWFPLEGTGQMFAAEDEAKAAAQADFGRRILSSIEPTPSPEPQASKSGAVDAWRDMASAPRDASEIVLRIPCQGWPDHYAQIGHWAEDMSGEEQPPFRGWFRKTGYGCAELNEPTGWMPLSSSNATLATPEPQTGERDGEVVAWAKPRGPWAMGEKFIWDEDRTEGWMREVFTEPLVRQSSLLAERTKTAAAYAEADHWKRKCEAAEVREKEAVEACQENASAWVDEKKRAEAAERRLAEVEERAEALIDASSTTYRKGNGTLGTLEGDDGEMMVIVPSCEFDELHAALRAKPEAHTLVGKEGDQ